LVIYCTHFRLLGELEDEPRENRLSATRASWSNAGRFGTYNCSKSHWQIGLDVFYKKRLQTAMIRRGRGVIEAATGADVIQLFPTTACSVWQDAL
jgi:hypothetical protein